MAQRKFGQAIFLLAMMFTFFLIVNGLKRRSSRRRDFYTRWYSRRDAIPTFQPRIWDVSKPIPYAFNGGFSEQEKQNFRESVQFWSAGTCIQFEEVSYDPNQRSVVVVQEGDRTDMAFCGEQDPETLVTIMTISKTIMAEALNIPLLAHEFGHALGLMHEHQRADRNVNVLLENVKPGDDVQFNVINGDEDGTPYDITSIMHYTGDEISKDPMKLLTLEAPDPDQEDALGLGLNWPSFNDYKIVNIHYQCAAITCKGVALEQECQNNGYQDPLNCAQCVCPAGVGGQYCTDVERDIGFNGQCGGLVNMDPCQSATFSLPIPSDQRYPYNASCTWVISSSACNLEFAFEAKPSMPYFLAAAHRCIDDVEIRWDFSRLDVPGKFFCETSNVENRKIVIPGGNAMIRFRSSTNRYRGNPDLGGYGFKLVAHTTCKKLSRSTPETGCRITESGFDVNGQTDLPFCGSEPQQVTAITGGPLPSPGASVCSVGAKRRQLRTYKRLFQQLRSEKRRGYNKKDLLFDNNF